MWILVGSDGSEDSVDTARLITGLGIHEGARITLLGAARREEPEGQLAVVLDHMAAKLEPGAEEIVRLEEIGVLEDQILRDASERPYDLIAVSAHERRRLLHFTLGSTAAILARRLHAPFLVSRNVPEKVERVLLCSGGEGPSLETLRQASRFLTARPVDATVLHVMSQVALRLDSPAEDLELTGERAIERGTREGQHLHAALEELEAAGLNGTIQPRLRHGLVVEEVLGEIEEGGYQLLVIGSHFRVDSSRWMELLLDDISEQLLARAPCSVLIMRPHQIG